MLVKVFGEVLGGGPQGGARVLLEDMIVRESERGGACQDKFYMQFNVSPRAC